MEQGNSGPTLQDLSDEDYARLAAGEADVSNVEASAPPVATDGEPPALESNTQASGQENADSDNGAADASAASHEAEEQAAVENARRLRALAVQERRLRDERREVKAQRERYAGQMAAVKELESNPLAALEKLGVPYEKIVRQIMAGTADVPAASDAPPWAQSLQKEVMALREARETDKREREAHAAEQQRAEIERAAISEINSELDGFDHCAVFEEIAPGVVAREVLSMVAAHYQRTRKVLPFTDALGTLERRLEERETRRLSALQARKGRKPKTVPSNNGSSSPSQRNRFDEPGPRTPLTFQQQREEDERRLDDEIAKFRNG